jgi:hydrogenase-4 component B
MQYTASSFAQFIVSLFSGVLRPSTHPPHNRGVLPGGSSFGSHVPEAVLDLVVEPFLRRQYERTMPIRRLQSGLLQQYVLYILITIMAIFIIGLF